jgi:hypothetical protein
VSYYKLLFIYQCRVHLLRNNSSFLSFRVATHTVTFGKVWTGKILEGTVIVHIFHAIYYSILTDTLYTLLLH